MAGVWSFLPWSSTSSNNNNSSSPNNRPPQNRRDSFINPFIVKPGAHSDHDIHNPHEHDYFRALGQGQRKPSSPLSRSRSRKGGNVLVNSLEGLSPPESAMVSGERRGFRSISLPTERTMASVSLESINEASIPSSPPELSYSKSSKSSSSINSDDDLSDTGLAEKSGHFEDVALEDGEREFGEDCNQPPDSRKTLRRPPPRSLTVGDMSSVKPGLTSPVLRPMPNAMRQKYPSLQGAVNGALRDQSLNLPNGRTMQRSASSPTSPYMRQQPQRIPSRSPSPNKPFTQNGYCVSPQALASDTPKGSFDRSKEIGLQRRPSWQPGRKTIEELEAEYNDEDEEVPDEAILENVPISPMPGQYNTSFRSPNHTALRSTTPSPHRKPSYANLHSANIPKQAKKRQPGPRPINTQYPPPRTPKAARPLMPHSATVSAFPVETLSRKHRSKSWTEDLNEEAKRLSQALEEYAEQLSVEKQASSPTTPTTSPPRPTMPKTRARTSIVEIPTTASIPTVPPLQKGNIMIDPLPISKEKEAVLSRTRPSWLPPKSQKEEKKHLKEFQQMMARAAEAEKKRALKQQESKENLAEMQGSVARIWEQHVLPNWDAVIREPRTRELWWKGITPRSRGQVWQKAIGNELELSAASYDAALARANALEEKLSDLPEEERGNNKEAAWMDAITRDVPNTFPELRMYQKSGPLCQSLTNVLKAYAMYRSDVGYVYGTHLVAGVICLLLEPPQAFVLLANLLNRALPLSFLVHDLQAMTRAYNLTLQTLKYKYTKLHDHLTNPALGLKPQDYLDPIFRCLFAYNLPHEHVCRIWDIFVFEGDKTLIRAAVAVLSKLESKLYTNKDEILDLIGWQNEKQWEMGDEEAFVAAIREAGKVDEKLQPKPVAWRSRSA